MGTATQMVQTALAEVGTKESPANSNCVKYAEWYGMNGEPWCDMFVAWCADQIGELANVGKFAYTPSHAQFFKDKGRWLDREEKPQPGDIVFFSNATRVCHVGIVVSRNSSNSVTTVEGNTSAGSDANGGEVQKRTRKYGSVGSSWYIAGFGRPAYGGESTTDGESTTADNDAGDTSGQTLEIDGKIGPKTVKALQSRLGTTVDGYIDGQDAKQRKYWSTILDSACAWSGGTSEVVYALQKLIGANADGELGKETAGMLQKHLIQACCTIGSCGVDGYFGSDSTKALQRWLNS